MCGVTPPFLQYIFMAWDNFTYTLTLTVKMYFETSATKSVLNYIDPRINIVFCTNGELFITRSFLCR